VNPRLLLVLVVAGALSLGTIAFALLGLSREASAGDERAAGPAGRVEYPAGAARWEGALKPPDLAAPDFALRTQDGDVLRMRDLRGKPVIVTFLYARCEESCPAQAQVIKGALDELGEDVPTLAVSVDPEEDTPARARHFLAEQGMSGRMEFVLGTPGELRPVWKGYAIQPQLSDAEHQAVIALVDARGIQRIGFPLNEATPRRLAHDVRLLAAEKTS
jgi:protein SCO1/2